MHTLKIIEFDHEANCHVALTEHDEKIRVDLVLDDSFPELKYDPQDHRGYFLLMYSVTGKIVQCKRLELMEGGYVYSVIDGWFAGEWLTPEDMHNDIFYPSGD